MKLNKSKLLFLSLIIGFSGKVIGSDYNPLNWVSNPGIIERWISKRMEERYVAAYKTKEYPIERTEFLNGIELAKKHEYDAVCEIYWKHGDSAAIAAGVMISHTDFPNEKAILTAAHVVDESKGKWTITFPTDNIPREVDGKFFCLSEKDDLAVFFLKDYPQEVEPAKRSKETFDYYGNDSFAHTVGYGAFLKQSKERYFRYTDSCSGVIIIPNRHHERHVVSNLYRLISDQRGRYLMSRPSKESTTIVHPGTGVTYPKGHIMPGFSGAPVYDKENQIVGINKSVDTNHWVGTVPQLSGLFYYLYSILPAYNKIEDFSHGLILGYRAHYIYGSALAYAVASSFSTTSRWTPWSMTNYMKAGFVGQMLLNILGGAVTRLSYHYPRYDVMDADLLTSQASPIDRYNKIIDKHLHEHYALTSPEAVQK